MKLNNVNKKWLKEFAGDKIYQRGHQYFVSGMVYNIGYSSEPLHLKAQVSGNYGDYEVIISDNDGNLRCRCDCPYDGYPCKHIVATLLTFLYNKKQHIDDAKKKTDFFISLKNRLARESHDTLVGIIIEAAQNNPEFKRALMAKFEPKSSHVLETFLGQIRYIIIDDFEDNYGSESEKIREFKKILRASEQIGNESRLIINWAIANKILDFLNQYGVSDDRWEEIVIQTFENIRLFFSSNSEELEEKKKDIIEQLEKYYNWGNCGLTDEIIDLIDDIKSQKV